jgi:ABC-type transporter Mla subunit MlaD
METSDIAIQQFENKLWSLQNKFLISIDNYRQALQQQYLEGKKNTSGSSQDQLNDTWAKTFHLYSQVNSNILENNKSIQNLDEYLDLLKAEVDIENDTLNQTINTQQAAVPREEYIKTTAQENYMTSAYYVAAVLGASVIIYKYY